MRPPDIFLVTTAKNQFHFTNAKVAFKRELKECITFCVVADNFEIFQNKYCFSLPAQ